MRDGVPFSHQSYSSSCSARHSEGLAGGRQRCAHVPLTARHLPLPLHQDPMALPGMLDNNVMTIGASAASADWERNWKSRLSMSSSFSPRPTRRRFR